MSYREVLALPIKTFLAMNRYVRRLMAEEDLRSLDIKIAMNSGVEAVKAIHERLVIDVTTDPVTPGEEPKAPVIEDVFDEGGFDELRMMQTWRTGATTA